MTSTLTIVKSLYEFESSDLKVLSFGVEEWFIVIKLTKPNEWLYVVNFKGRLGYIPANYVTQFKIDDNELLKFIDKVACQLDAKNNDSLAITDRQVKHAQIKLAQLRCEIVQRLFKRTHPETIVETENEIDCDDGASNEMPNENEKSEENRKSIEKSNEQNDKNEIPFIPESHDIPDQLIPDLIERVRVCADLSHDLCKLTVRTVISCLMESIPSWTNQCQAIIKKLDDQNIESHIHSNVQSSDLINLKAAFKKLWWCKNDEQQRSWPVHQDEDLIRSYLDEIHQIISNANPMHIRDLILGFHYENVHMLVTYFQMETRRSLRMKLLTIFHCLIGIFEQLIPEYFLSSVLPAELAVEMQNYIDDEERWCSSALLFTSIFSTAHKPPINIYEHINEIFIDKQLNIIESIDGHGNRIDDLKIPPENSIAPILSFNLHFDDPETNLVLNALRKRKNASQLTENLVSYLNWEEDITKVNCTKLSNEESSQDDLKMNSALKLLIEMFDDNLVSKLFYYNDVRVIIDIIIRQLNNLPAGDKMRSAYLKLASNIIKNTSYNEEPHKLDEFLKCLKSIQNDDYSTEDDKKLVQQIHELNANLFKL